MPAACAACAVQCGWQSHPTACLPGVVPSPALRVCSLAADFVVRQELLEEDMADLLHHLNARKGGWACC